MVKYTSSIIVPFARDRVWRLMSDWTNLAVWDLNITKSVLADDQKPDQVGIGTKYDCEFSANGMENVKVDYECVYFDAPTKAQYVGMARFFRSVDSIECEAEGENTTKLTAEFNLCFRGLLSPFSFLMNGTMQKTGPIVMKDIEKFVTERLTAD